MSNLRYGFLLLGSAILAGCPIYTESSYGNYGPSSCDVAADCGYGYSCLQNQCVYNTTGGDCSQVGCPTGFQCTLYAGALHCLKGSTVGTDGGTFSGCKSDNQCTADAGVGAKCLNGSCVPTDSQCTDATQCKGKAQCVQGACTPTCDTDHPCSTGYSCDTTKGVCTGNPNPCGSGTCSGSSVCVSDHCVDPCGAGKTCSAGLVCVGGGCIPDQKPQFVCGTDGTQDACARGSICLHHNCYISCGDSDAGDGGASCATADQFNLCKDVVTASGSHQVCGSAKNLGSECDPTLSKNCSDSKICIDGFCR